MTDTGGGDAKDVFISFTHIDDKPLYDGQAGWVTEFHRHLETRLSALLGRETRVWRDPNLQGNEVLLAAIERQLQRVKALVSVLSPRYVKSGWCQKEIQGFLNVARGSGGFQVGDQLRWFKVLKTPLGAEDLPPDFPGDLRTYFQNVLGYSFFDVDPQSKRPREYSREFGSEAERLYHQKVYDLAWDIQQLLKKIDAGQLALPGLGPGRKTIYLATGTADVASQRDRIRRELQERGHLVLGEGSLPWVASEMRDHVRAVLRQCDVSVHFVGSLYGFVPEGTTESAAAIQNAVAAEVSQEGRLRRILHLPKDPIGAEDRQGAFLRELRDNEAAQAGAEVLDGPVEQVKEVLLGLLEPPPPERVVAKHAASSSPSVRPPLVYLIGDQSDEASLDRVDDFFFQRGLEVTRPTYTGSEEERGKAHRRRLVECDAAMIYYGSPSRDWVDMELMDLEQARGYGREKEYRARAVCLGPPDDRGKQRFRTRAAEVLHFDGQNPEVLSPFVERLLTGN